MIKMEYYKENKTNTNTFRIFTCNVRSSSKLDY